MSVTRTLGRFGAALAAVSAAVSVVAGCSDLPARKVDSAPPLLQKPSISISPDNGGPIAPRQPIVVKADRGTLAAVAVTAESGKSIAGALSPDQATWTSTEPLAYGAGYQVSADAISLTAGRVRRTAQVNTVTPRTQTFAELVPGPDAADSYGVGTVIGVRFDENITDRAAATRALEVVSNPPQPGAWYWMDDRTARYRPERFWQPGTTVTVHANVYGVHLGDGVYGQEDRAATYRIHDAWIAKADGGSHQMQIFRNGQLVSTMPISLGSPSNPTHLGTHVVSSKSQSTLMDSCTFGLCPPNPGAYKQTVYLTVRISDDGEYTHSAPWSVGQQGSTNVSHGCVNLSPANAQWMLDTFGVGDVIEVVNSGGTPLPVWDTYGGWMVPWAEWVKGGPTT
ncbi:MAG: L,D-transpeptidase [Mycobacteriaceae bacterium]|nr:L,D-transpeptidase [Mycobacteriaceae bacterium]